jgi:mono/diheme cytochrome c family protein
MKFSIINQLCCGIMTAGIFLTGINPLYAQASRPAWVAPESAGSMKNPFTGNPSAATEGKQLFTSMCVICHGETGKGNGVAGVTLTPHPANFLGSVIRAESDGALFWKMSEGNAPMASYKTMLSEEQRWKLVCYIRELQKNNKK